MASKLKNAFVMQLGESPEVFVQGAARIYKSVAPSRLRQSCDLKTLTGIPVGLGLPFLVP
jgi:hypothetical protein